METPIIVVDTDKTSCRALCNLLEGRNYRVIARHSLANLQGFVRENSSRVVIVSLDTVAVDNRSLRDLKMAFPDLRVIAVSGRRFHPDLKEAMTSHIYACLGRPIDPDELVYWLKSVVRDASISEDRPGKDGWKTPP